MKLKCKRINLSEEAIGIKYFKFRLEQNKGKQKNFDGCLSLTSSILVIVSEAINFKKFIEPSKAKIKVNLQRRKYYKFDSNVIKTVIDITRIFFKNIGDIIGGLKFIEPLKGKNIKLQIRNYSKFDS